MVVAHNSYLNFYFTFISFTGVGAVGVAQLAERLLPTPEIRSSNPNIGNEIFGMYLSVLCNPEKTKITEKRPEMAHF